MPGDQRAQDLMFMRMALEEAVPGAGRRRSTDRRLDRSNSQVLAQTHNYRELWQDPTAHAEVIAIRAAATALGTWRLTDYDPLRDRGALLDVYRCDYSSEDFPSRLWGMGSEAGACGSVFDFTNEPRLNHRVEILGGLLELESQALIQQFFRQLRTG